MIKNAATPTIITSAAISNMTGKFMPLETGSMGRGSAISARILNILYLR